jgi:tripartite-type tricarboxylate transporter receptor subunit TctC
MKSTAKLVLLAIAALAQLPAFSQSDVTRILIAAPPGGGTDTVFRIMAKEAGPLLQQTIVAVNAPAAGGIVAIEQMLAAAPNGRLLVGVANSSITATPHILKVPFAPTDYVPIVGISSSPYVMCVSPAFPADTARALVDELKRSPGRYTIGTDGGSGQLASGRVLRALGAEARNIPFKGASEILAAFLGGHIDIYSGSVPGILANVKAGKAKCLLLTTAERSPALPQAAGLKDMGIPGEETPLWWILIAHKATPQDVLTRIREAAEKSASSPAMRQFLTETGNPHTISTGDDLVRRLVREYEALGATAKALGMTPK